MYIQKSAADLEISALKRSKICLGKNRMCSVFHFQKTAVIHLLLPFFIVSNKVFSR